jgi:hypothetical protein
MTEAEQTEFDRRLAEMNEDPEAEAYYESGLDNHEFRGVMRGTFRHENEDQES